MHEEVARGKEPRWIRFKWSPEGRLAGGGKREELGGAWTEAERMQVLFFPKSVARDDGRRGGRQTCGCGGEWGDDATGMGVAEWIRRAGW
jgi:hypothetical protein